MKCKIYIRKRSLENYIVSSWSSRNFVQFDRARLNNKVKFKEKGIAIILMVKLNR